MLLCLFYDCHKQFMQTQMYWLNKSSFVQDCRQVTCRSAVNNRNPITWHGFQYKIMEIIILYLKGHASTF